MTKHQFLKAYGGKPVSLTNLISNGNFASTTGWTSTGASFSVANNEATVQATAANGRISGSLALLNTHKYYSCSWINSSSALVASRVSDGVSFGQSVYSSGSGNYEFISQLYTAIRTATGTVSPVYDTRTSGWTTVYSKYVTVVDLTAAFGAGNEPTKEQMDTLMAQFANNWIDGTKTAFYNW